MFFNKLSTKSIYPDSEGKLHLDECQVKKKLDKNIQLIEQIFKDDGTLRKRVFKNQVNSSSKYCAFFIDGMVDNKIIDEYVIKPIITSCCELGRDKASDIISKVIVSNDVKEASSFDGIVQGIISGDTALFIDGSSRALIISTKGWQSRPIAEPDAERGLRGPREGFTEAIMVNLSMLRRKISTPDLKFTFRTFGTRSNTKACICYIDSLVDDKILNELNQRLNKIDIDGVLDVNYISELIKDSPMSFFKTIGISERPDVVAGKLLEGRVALFLDGTPVVLTLPYLFIENFQSNDDYYLNFYFASVGRLLRILGFLLTVSVPAIYLAFTSFHREMIPTDLALSIIEARRSIPFPTFLECIIMLITFEIIREAGIRMPSNIGQALSIVGALVVGQAAVEAKFISAPMVIIVAITAITGLINPKLKGAAILFRFLLLFSAAVLGLYGYAFAVIGFFIHLFSLKSFGVIYTSHLSSINFREAKDRAIRAPWKYMNTRPAFAQKDQIRKK